MGMKMSYFQQKLSDLVRSLRSSFDEDEIQSFTCELDHGCTFDRLPSTVVQLAELVKLLIDEVRRLKYENKTLKIPKLDILYQQEKYTLKRKKNVVQRVRSNFQSIPEVMKNKILIHF